MKSRKRRQGLQRDRVANVGNYKNILLQAIFYEIIDTMNGQIAN
jgi:hypothetical protein